MYTVQCTCYLIGTSNLHQLIYGSFRTCFKCNIFIVKKGIQNIEYEEYINLYYSNKMSVYYSD